jgi:protein-S-isoprenylcysteine O-methyltransferase Ste14
MSAVYRTIEKIHQIATGDKKRRKILAFIFGSLFALLTFLFAAIPVHLESSRFIAEPFNIIVSLPLAVLGVVLMMWTSLQMFVTKGTPVPVDPPQKLITSGPYRVTRNPMHTGLFLVMVASGFYYGSLLSLLVFTPAYIILDTLMIKYIEEPGLEKRLGEDYVKYKERTPMFFPRLNL